MTGALLNKLLLSIMDRAHKIYAAENGGLLHRLARCHAIVPEIATEVSCSCDKSACLGTALKDKIVLHNAIVTL